MLSAHSLTGKKGAEGRCTEVFFVLNTRYHFPLTAAQYSLVNFETAYKMTSPPSVLTWQLDKKQYSTTVKKLSQRIKFDYLLLTKDQRNNQQV